MKAVVDPQQDLLERTLRSARRVEAPGIDEDEARARTVRAIARARALDRRHRRIFVSGALAMAAAAFALVTWTMWPRPEHSLVRAPTPLPATATSNEASLVRLPSGDRIQADPGAHYDVESTELDRRVRLNRGRVRFDVASLAGGSFVVDAGTVSVHVRGTVFSVRHDGVVVAVEVFEGAVEVRFGEARALLGPGDRWTSDEPASDAAESPESTAGSEARASVELPVARRESNASTGSSRSEARVRLGAPEPASDAAASSEARASVARRESNASTGSSRSEARVRLGDSEGAAPAGRRLDPSLDDARRLLIEHDFEGALAACGDRDDAEWRVLRADALRGLRRWRDAAEAYDAAIPLLVEARRAALGYAAARLWSEQVGNASAALASLRASHAAAIGSPLEERARVLEIELLRRLGRDDGVQVREYLERYPAARESGVSAPVEPFGRP